MISQPQALPAFPIIAVALLTGLVIWIVSSLKRTDDTAPGGAKPITSVFLFVVGGIPLLIYPLVLLANAMTLAGQWRGNEPGLLIVLVLLFVTVSSAYPLTYFWCLLKARNSNKRTIISLVPIIHLIIAVLLGLIWSGIGNG